MPIYEYRCEDCEQVFETLVKSTRRPRPVACPHCGSKQVARKLSVFAAQQGRDSSSSLPGPCERCGERGGTCPMAR